MSNYPAVYVGCGNPALGEAVRKCLPTVNVIDFDITPDGGTTGENRSLVLSAEVLFAEALTVSDALKNSKTLKWAQTVGAGVEPITALYKKAPEDIQVTRMGEGYDEIMSEYVIGYVIVKHLHFIEMYNNQKGRIWDRKINKGVKPLSSMTIGILGAGSIGTAVARTCKSFGMTVFGLCRQKRGDNVDLPFDRLMTREDLPSLLQSCDIVCNLLPSTPLTRKLLSGDVLANCQGKCPEFINVGRGDVIDESSLIKALRNKWIKGAVLDVHDPDPVPPESELWDMQNVLITPHIANCCSMDLRAKVFARNYQNFIEGKPLQHTINWEGGY